MDPYPPIHRYPGFGLVMLGQWGSRASRSEEGYLRLLAFLTVPPSLPPVDAIYHDISTLVYAGKHATLTILVAT